MEKLKLGQWNKLKATWKVDFGMYLEGGGYDGKILLPERYVPEDLKIGDEIDVFLYLDNEERLVATTLEPKAMVGDFAYLEVAWVNEYGAFLDWGLMKDLFCPFCEQKRRMEKGRSYIVHVHVDEESYRIMASAKVEKFLAPTPPRRLSAEEGGLHIDQEVELLVWQKTDLGFKVIINNRYAGLLYDTQVFRNIHTGDRVKGYISNIRSDGKIDCSLQRYGQHRQHTEDFSARLLRYLETQGGRCRLGDKSDAEEIKEQFGVSKRTYKQAVGDLYKRRLIRITENGIELV